MELLPMSAKELDRLNVIQQLDEKRMTQREAARILGLGVRHIKRMLKAYRKHGAAGLVSRHRGRESNKRLSESTRQQAVIVENALSGIRPDPGAREVGGAKPIVSRMKACGRS